MAEDTGGAEGATVEAKAEGIIVEAGVEGDAGRAERVSVRRRFLSEYHGALVIVDLTITNGHVRELYRQFYDIISRQYFFAWFYGGFRGQRGNYMAISRELSRGHQSGNR